MHPYVTWDDELEDAADAAWAGIQQIPSIPVLQSDDMGRTQLAEVLRYACQNPIFGYHHYFAGCADGGNGNKAVVKDFIAHHDPEQRQSRFIGGMKHEIDLREHLKSAPNPADARAMRDHAKETERLTKLADQGAKGLKIEDLSVLEKQRTILEVEIRRLSNLAAKQEASHSRSLGKTKDMLAQRVAEKQLIEQHLMRWDRQLPKVSPQQAAKVSARLDKMIADLKAQRDEAVTKGRSESKAPAAKPASANAPRAPRQPSTRTPRKGKYTQEVQDALDKEIAALQQSVREAKARKQRVQEAEQERGYANQTTIYGAGHRIIGNLGAGGSGKLTMGGVTHVGHHDEGMSGGGSIRLSGDHLQGDILSDIHAHAEEILSTLAESERTPYVTQALSPTGAAHLDVAGARAALNTLMEDDPGRATEHLLNLADALDIQHGTTMHDDLVDDIFTHAANVVDHLYGLESFGPSVGAELRGIDPKFGQMDEIPQTAVQEALTSLLEDDTARGVNSMLALADAVDTQQARDEERMQIADAPHEHRFVEQRCLVCGCDEPRNPHEQDLPILQPDAPLGVAPHTDEKQTQLALTTCPACGKSAQDITDTGYWYTGMVCPQCGHAFTASDERTTMVDELRSLRAEVLRAIEGEVMRPFVVAAMEPQETRWAEHEIVRGAGGKIIGNIYNGVFHPAEGVSHEHVREALALHDPASVQHQALTAYVGEQMAQQEAYWRDRVLLYDLEAKTDDLERAVDEAANTLSSELEYGDEADIARATKENEEARAQYDAHLAQLRAVRARINANPAAAHIHELPPTVVHTNDDTDGVMHAIFGRTLADHEFARLVGAQPGDLVTVHYERFAHVGYHSVGHGIAIGLLNANGDYEAKRTIYRDGNTGKITIHNDAMVVEDTGKGTATRIFSAQVRGAIATGVDVIETVGGKGYYDLLGHDVNMNGYATWPKLGYNGELSATFVSSVEEDLGMAVATVRDMMRTPELRDYWKHNGYSIGLEFDLAEGSQSRADLKTYLDAKGLDSTGI